MNRKALRRQADAVVTPMLTRGEQFRRAGPVWAVEARGRAPLLFRARDPHVLVLTDQRLILLGWPRRRRPLGATDLVIAKRYSTFIPVRSRRFRPMLQIRLRTSADRVLVLEFRPRDRGLAHKLVRELGPPDRRHRRRKQIDGRTATDEHDLAELLGP